MKVIIAGGGTGGHIFPGVAIADAFREMESGTEIIFMGAERGLETRVVPQMGYELVTLPVAGIMNMGAMRGVARSVGLMRAVLKAYGILGRLSPDLVVGVGGYASVPGVIAAALRRIPGCILEQNVIPGKANLFLSRFVQRIYLGFPTDKPVFPAEKTVITGNPIRKQALISGEKDNTAGERKHCLLILGGSQGAAQLNDLAMEAVPALLRGNSSLEVIHQTGAIHEERVKDHYEKEGVEVEVVPFIPDMGNYYARADLCLSRAGAMAVSELAAAGLPAILIPFPHAAGNHQRANSRWLETFGGAVTLEADGANPALLLGEIEHLLNSPSLLEGMASACKRAGTVNAARRIAGEEIRRVEELGHRN